MMGDSCAGKRPDAPRPILFLDVDGVLHPLKMEVKDGKASVQHSKAGRWLQLCFPGRVDPFIVRCLLQVVDDHCFQPQCCQELVRIAATTGASVGVRRPAADTSHIADHVDTDLACVQQASVGDIHRRQCAPVLRGLQVLSS